jgi:hypothetical protein
MDQFERYGADARFELLVVGVVCLMNCSNATTA